MGATVRDAAGEVGVVEALVVVDAPQTMYNLTIELVATYVVGSGQWVVHNCEVPMRDFAHSSKLEHLENIIENGLSEIRAINNNLGGRVNRSGHLFTVEVTPTTLGSVSADLIALGSRHTGSGENPGILIMRLPATMFEKFLSNESVIVRPIAGLDDVIETVFKPETFSTINQGVRDGTVVFQLLNP